MDFKCLEVTNIIGININNKINIYNASEYKYMYKYFHYSHDFTLIDSTINNGKYILRSYCIKEIRWIHIFITKHIEKKLGYYTTWI